MMKERLEKLLGRELTDAEFQKIILLVQKNIQENRLQITAQKILETASVIGKLVKS